ncbi:hypothetical protein FQN50_003610 [Emmonsiellopsis sp. PD_5]|nr:hypothetical protein FQN50_003610 [Emmonsiellopsis sp. PD_5]
MEYTEGSLGHLADANTKEILRHFRGYAKIDLSHFICEGDSVVGSRPRGKNADRLLRIFKSAGCDRRDPEHHIPVLISNDILDQALSRSQMTQEALLSSIDPPQLILGSETRLVYLKGKSRLGAAHEFFLPGNKWWGAKLYLDTLPPAAKAQLREKYQNEQNFNDGDIYRNLRHYQLQGDKSEVARWWARWVDSTKCRDVMKMQKNKQLRAAFDRLLPYIGLWAPVTAKLFRRALEWRCYDESAHYLYQIDQVWSPSFPGASASLVDAPSVLELEGLMPSYSLADRDHIRNLMEGGLFPAVTGLEERSRILQTLLQVPGRILSLHTFSQDLIYLELPARALRGLLPKRFKSSFHNAMGRRYTAGSGKCCVQSSPDEYEEISFGNATPPNEDQLAAYLSYVQLWICAMRQFVIPFRDPLKTAEDAYDLIHMRGLPLLANVARRLGFVSKEIGQQCLRDTDNDTARYLIEHICEIELYKPSPKAIAELTHQVKRYLKHTFQNRTLSSTPAFGHNGREGDAQCRRYNRPAAAELRSDRPCLFVGHVYGCDQPASQHPTSFAVTREVIFSFFGKEPLYALFQMRSGNLNQEHVYPVPGECDNQITEAAVPEVPPPMQPASDPADPPADPPETPRTPVHMEPHPLGSPGMDDIQPTPPLAPGFEDIVSALLDQKMEISVHRSAKDILRIWYGSPRTSLVVLFLFTSRSYYKFTTEQQFSLRSTISLLARDHYFMSSDEQTVGSLTDTQVLSEALEKKLLFVGLKSAPGYKSTEPLGSMNASSGDILLEDLREYLSFFDVVTGKRVRSNIEERREKKRARDTHPNNVMEEEI